MIGGRLHALTDISVVDQHCYVAPMRDDAPVGDDVYNSNRSTLRLFEDGLEIGPAHALHETIVGQGGGAFSHWGRQLYFSSSDRSDPRANGRLYTILYDPAADESHRSVLLAALAVDLRTLGAEEKYGLGERVFNAVVPDVMLSEYGRSMFGDAEFLADYKRFDRANYRSFDRKFALRELFKLVYRVAGDVAECGVYRGGSAFLLAKAMARHAQDKRLHLFDSFAGLSQPGPLDGSHWRAGALACGLAEVSANLAEHVGRTVFHAGWIPDCLADAADRKFCFVHVDVDLYEPTKASLDFFRPRMVPGGIIVCDDYGFETCPGARRAVDEFAASNFMPVVHLPTGQGVLFVGYPTA
jgi:hypothetical protein